MTLSLLVSTSFGMPSVRGDAVSLPQTSSLNVLSGNRRRWTCVLAPPQRRHVRKQMESAPISPEIKKVRGASGVGSSKAYCERAH